MEKPMRIRITRGHGWYTDKVGEVFSVNEVEQDGDDTLYHLDPPEYAYEESGRRHVLSGDCELVSNASDAVQSPSHYTQGGIEVIDIIAQTVAGYDDPFVAHCVGTATKYLNRAPYKHDSPLEDLRKAAKYIEFAIEHLNEKLTKEGE